MMMSSKRLKEICERKCPCAWQGLNQDFIFVALSVLKDYTFF